MTPPLTEEQQAAVLARWLEAGARGAPPEGLDPDVVEAVLALRPDLAPAPRVTADDILAGIEAGPFAPGADVDDDAPGAEIVPFPVPVSRPATPQPVRARPRGQGLLVLGLATALAAAAAMVVVLGPTDRALDPAAGSAPALTAAPTPEAAPAPDAATADDDAVADVPEATEPGYAAPAERSARRTKAGEAVGGDVGGLRDQAEGEATPRVAAELAAPAAPPPAAAAKQEEDGVALEEADEVLRQESRDRAPTGYGSGYGGGAAKKAAPQRAAAPAAEPELAENTAAGVVADTRDDGTTRIEAEIAACTTLAKTDPIGAAARLASSIRFPADAGQRAAILATTWTLDHDRPDLAVGYANRGLVLQKGGALADLLRSLKAEAEARAAEVGTKR